MKKSVKRILCSVLSLTFLSTLTLERVLSIGESKRNALSATQTTVTTTGDGVAKFENVTGQFDTTALRQSQFNNQVKKVETPTYETRTVLVTLSKKGIVESANGDTVNSYLNSWNGKQTQNAIRDEQDAFLQKLKKSGISYKLVYRYDAVMNGVAIETNTKHVSTIKAMSGVKGVEISRTYAAPTAVETTDAADITNITSVYDTGIYDTAVYTDVAENDTDGGAGDYGEGTVVAILDTGLDYTHEAFQRLPDNPAWSKADVSALLEKNLKAKETTSQLNINDVYVSAKVPFAYDYADKDPDVYPSYSNHGTHVAGIIGGYTDVATGYTDKDGKHVANEFRGVAPDSQLVICKVFTDDLESKDIGGAIAEDIIAALNDCVLLGVDVINMSLGTSCGFTTTDDGDEEGTALNNVYQAIQTAGISLVCAASNDYSSGYGGVFGTNLISNPDSSTVGSPSTFSSALSVASISGQKSPYMTGGTEEKPVYAFYEESRDENGKAYDFIAQMLGDEEEKEFEYVVVQNTGRAEDYTKADLFKDGNGNSRGRIALVKRGDSTFKEKVEIATKMGAKAIIVYNNVAGIIRMNLGEIDNPIPAVSINMDAGQALFEAAGGINKVGKITISKNTKAGPFMSEFSSWGPTHDLKIKPEITAHGGEITSTVPGGYGEQSGTSMASPNMAGVMALVRNYIKTQPALSALATKDGAIDPVLVNRLANQLMMSTATTAVDQQGLPYSPRKQGAGLGSLDNVITKTSAYLSVDNAENDYRPKLEVGDDPAKTGEYTMTFTVHNFGATALSFTARDLKFTETIAKDGLAVAEKAYMLDDYAGAFKVNGQALDGAFSVGAGDSAEVSVTLTLSESEKRYLAQFPNGMYVEGFLKLTPTAECANEQCELTVPFLAFYGDWEVSDMLDYSVYEVAAEQADASILEEDKIQASVFATQPFATYFNETYVIPMGGYVYLYDEDEYDIYTQEAHAAISRYNEYHPEDENQNYMTTTELKAVYAGLLRNARVVEYNLYNVQTGELLRSDSINRVSKAYAGGGSAVPANVKLEIKPEDYNMLSNGQYRMDLTFYMNDPKTNTVYGDDPSTGEVENANNSKDTFSFSFTVDYEAPILEDVRVRYYDYKEGTKEKQRIYLDVDVYDNHYAQALMLCYPVINAQGETVLQLATEYPTPVMDAVRNGTNTVSIEITDIYEKYGSQLYIQVDDYALNSCLYKLDITKAVAGNLPANGEFALADGEDNITLGLYETHKVSLVYEGDANLSNFAWTSSNPLVAGVKNGEIVGLKAGTATVRVSAYGSTPKKIQVTVTDEKTGNLPNVPSLSFGVIKTSGQYLQKAEGRVQVNAGETFDMEVLLDPWYHPMTNLAIVYKTDNPSVATVDENGKVSTLKKGTAQISAVIYRNGKETLYSCSVTMRVVEEFDVSNYTLTKYHGVGYNEGDPALGTDVLVIPTDMNIMYIGEDAFKDNDNIRRIVIPASVTQIQETAFENCTALEEVYFVSTQSRVTYENGVKQENADIDWADLSMVYQRAFYNCKNLKKLDLSNVKTTTVAHEAFVGCTSLSEIVDMTSIGTAHDMAFYGCTSLTSLDLTGLHMSGRYVFAGCTGLTEITTGQFTAIGEGMFYGCTGLQDTVVIRGAKVGAYAFYGCKNLEGVKFQSPAGLAIEFEIGVSAFENCGVNAFSLDAGNEIVRVIGDNAFKNSKLSSLSLNMSGLEKLGGGVFSGTQIQIVYIDDSFDIKKLEMTGVPFDGIDLRVASGSKYKTLDKVIYTVDGDTITVVYVNDGDTALDLTAIHALENTTTAKIGAYALAGNDTVRSIVGADTITQIGNGAFENAKVQSLSLPMVTKVGDSAFYNSALSEFAFGNALTEIGNYAFAYSALRSFSYSTSTSLAEIGDYAFAGCLALANITLPDGAKTMGNGVFYGCTALKTVVLPSVENMGAYTFMGCTALQKVDFGDTATTTGNYTFRNTPVTTVTLGTATQVGDYAFDGCSKLTTIALTNMTRIGNGAFRNCVALRDVDLSFATEIGKYAFYGCGELRTVDLAMLAQVGDYAFANCGKLAGVNMENAQTLGRQSFFGTAVTAVDLSNATIIGDGALANCKALATIAVGETNDNGVFTVIDGVLYRYMDKASGAYALVCYPAGMLAPEVAQADESVKRIYAVKEGTTLVQAYAFYGLKAGAMAEVKLPYSVKVIGDSAFFASGIKTYTFESMQAPTLETVYREEVEETIKNMATDATVSLYRGYYYANFETCVFDYSKYGTKTSNLAVNYPSNATGYDNFVYGLYFGTANTTGVAMTDATRDCQKLVASLHDTETVQSWLALPVTPENKAMVEAFSAIVKTARAGYNDVLKDDAQTRLFGAENAEKLLAVESALREVKKRFGVQTYVTGMEVSKASTHKSTYAIGTTFDMTGLVITIVYDDGSTMDVDASVLTLVDTHELTELDSYVRVEYTENNSTQTSYIMINVVESLPDDDVNDGANGRGGAKMGLILGLVGGVLLVAGFIFVETSLRKKGTKKESVANGTTEETKDKDEQDTRAE